MTNNSLDGLKTTIKILFLYHFFVYEHDCLDSKSQIKWFHFRTE